MTEVPINLNDALSLSALNTTLPIQLGEQVKP